MTPLPQHKKPKRASYHYSWVPSRSVEYAYYFVIAYSILAAYLGVEVPLVAAALTVALAYLCFKQAGSHARQVYGPIALLLACQVSFVLVQVVAYGTSIMEEINRNFILWFC